MAEKATLQEMVEAVKTHAAADYERWNVVVETYSDADIEELIGKSRSASGAIRKVWETVRVRNAVQADVQNA